MTDWENIRVVNGFASHIPEALAGLTSPDPEVRHRSYWMIDNFAVVQRDLYEAAYPVIVPLQSILETNRDPHVRSLCYELLFEIYNGYAEDIDTVEIEPGKLAPLMWACRAAVEARLDLYAQDVTATNEELRSKAVDLISSFYTLKVEAGQVLEHALHASTDEAARMTVRRGLRDLLEEE